MANSTHTKCLVPFCQRTSGKRSCYEFICGAHWRNVPRRQRLFLFRLRRKLRRAYNERTDMQERRAWRRCKRLALRRAF